MPGVYLRLRREAAGLSISDVAMLIATRKDLRIHAALVIDDVERGRYLPDELLLDQLRVAFRFDRFIVAQLAGEDLGLPAPDLCRACGCSWADPCDDERNGPCAWAAARGEDGLRLCTHCLTKEVSMPGKLSNRTIIHAQNCKCPRCAPWRGRTIETADVRALQGGAILGVIAVLACAALKFAPVITATILAWGGAR